MNKKRWTKESLVGAGMLLLSIVLLIAGVFVSVHFQMPRLFWAFSTPAAVLIVLGGAKVLREMAPGAAKWLSENAPNTGGEMRGRLDGSSLWPFRRMPSKVEAEVIGVTRNIRNAGDKMAYYVLCKWTDPKTGKEFTFTSRALQEYPGKEVIGKTVDVHIDPKDPGNYTVDLDPILPEKLRLHRA